MGTACLLLNGTASADSRDRTIFQLQHTGWTAREGAPGSINTLAQTTDGYIWLGTSSGLFRFDGVHFDRYELPSGEKLKSDDINSLMATSDGGLWIGFHYGNMAFMKDGRITSYGESEGLPSGTIYRFVVDREGTVWAAVGVVSSGSKVHAGNKLEKIGHIPENPQRRCSWIARERFGWPAKTPWFFSREVNESSKKPARTSLVACRREIVTTDAVRRVGVLPVDRLSIG